MGSFPKVITLEDAAQRLLTSPDRLRTEIEAGRLSAFTVGGEWRTTEEALLEFMAGQDGVTTADEERIATMKTLEIEWTTTGPFSHIWPNNGVENYECGHTGIAVWRGKRVVLMIGCTDRKAAGKDDRRRVIVFLGQPPRTRPAVEFAGANDFESSGRLASVIKLPSGKHLKPEDPVPEDYRDFDVDIYTNVVCGKGAARSAAVVADKCDLTTMARHALIRAEWYGWFGH